METVVHVDQVAGPRYFLFSQYPPGGAFLGGGADVGSGGGGTTPDGEGVVGVVVAEVEGTKTAGVGVATA
jgi:hypothetical protein